jgi:hypothetical protein
MTAVTDLGQILTLLLGKGVTEEQTAKVVDAALRNSFADHPVHDKDTDESRAQAVLDGLRDLFVGDVKRVAADEVYAAAIRQAHYPADQKALLAAAKGTADAAGDSAAEHAL